MEKILKPVISLGSSSEWADPDSNGALGVVSWKKTKLRQNVKTINDFMAEIEMGHLFVINF